MTRWILLPFSLFLCAPPLRGQQLRGDVRDVATGGPIEGALLTAIGPDSVVRGAALSEPDGSFRLNVPPIPGLQLRAERVGYATQRSAPLTLARGDTLRLAIGMRVEAVALEGVTVRAVDNQNLRHFLRRQSTGFGNYLGPEQIARIPTRSTTHLLLGMTGSPLMLGRDGRTLSMRSRGVTSQGGAGACPPSIYVDGYSVSGEDELRRETRRPTVGAASGVPSGVVLESLVPHATIRAVEVYHNPAQVPGEYQRSFMKCGVVLIWTDYGFGFEVPSARASRVRDSGENVGADSPLSDLP